MKISKSKRLWMILFWSLYTAFIIIFAVLRGMENLAIAGIGIVSAAITFYLHAETKRPSTDD